MHEALEILKFAVGPVLLFVPLCYAVAAAWPASRYAPHLDVVWRRALFAAGCAFGVSVLLAVALAVFGESAFQLLTIAPLGRIGALTVSVRLDVLTSIMLILVSFVGLVIVRFSRRYLAGDTGQPRYVRWLLATLAAVTLLVISNNLVLLALSWVCTGLALHQLLTFYGDRQQALIAAHKKFLVSRFADICLFGSCALIGLTCGSLEMNEIFSHVRTMPDYPAALHWAAVLLAIAALLKCAQLPVHGWLIQVMEAPTPVSALLHAGVVNIGGFLMIRMSPLMVGAESAQALLVIVGSFTAVVAALTMMTRVSVKVMLAWSTCAQMGFMLMQCGLGAYELAALHLVGHALYKAHAFLSSGSVVEQYRLKAMSPTPQQRGLALWAGALVVSSLIVAATALVCGAAFSEEPALWALAWIVTCAITTLLVRSAPRFGWQHAFALVGASVTITTLYFLAHTLLSSAQLAPSAVGSHLSAALVGWVVGCFSVLFVLHAAIGAYPQGRLLTRLYPHLFARLYLDELFTRLTFRIWPAKLVSHAARSPATTSPSGASVHDQQHA